MFEFSFEDNYYCKDFKNPGKFFGNEFDPDFDGHVICAKKVSKYKGELVPYFSTDGSYGMFERCQIKSMEDFKKLKVKYLYEPFIDIETFLEPCIKKEPKDI